MYTKTTFKLQPVYKIAIREIVYYSNILSAIVANAYLLTSNCINTYQYYFLSEQQFFNSLDLNKFY